MNGLSLCSGIGGIELGLRLALGSTYRTVCMVEGEAYCVEVLVRRMQEGRIDECPIWDDLTTFPCKDWRGRVDIISAGFPCQPVSCAGQRKAQEDERWLWPHIIKIIRQVCPEWVLLENVRGLLSANSGRAFAEVLGGLADAGYDAEWMCLSAAECGAPHRRERIFILAHSRRFGRGGRPEGIREVQGRKKQAEGPSGELENSHHGRGGGKEGSGKGNLRGVQGQEQDGHAHKTGNGQVVNTDDKGLAIGQEPENGRGNIWDEGPTAFPPGPEERDGWTKILERWPELIPAVDDANRWNGRNKDTARRDLQTRPENTSQDGTASEIESPVRRMAHGPTNRVDRLRACGNGVVPVVAATAFTILYKRFTQ